MGGCGKGVGTGEKRENARGGFLEEMGRMRGNGGLSVIRLGTIQRWSRL